MALTKEQNEALVAELKTDIYDGLTATDAIDILHNGKATETEIEAWPEITIQALLGILSPASKAKLVVFPHLLDIREKIVSQDRAGLGLWAELLNGVVITQSERDAMLAVVSSPVKLKTTSRDIPRIATQFQDVKSERTIGDGDEAKVESFGFPNAIDAGSFNAAWVAAGRKL